MTTVPSSPAPAPDKPGRRAAARELRREAIMDMAMQVFMENGYAGTTMSEIAARLGGSKGTLWSYFPSKEALFAAVLDRATSAFRAELVEVFTPQADVAQALRRFCLHFVAKLTSPEAVSVHRTVVGEARRFPELGRIFFESAPGRTRKMVADYLAEAMQRGALRQGDPMQAAMQLTGMCMAGCHMELLVGVIDSAPARRIETEVDAAVRAFMASHGPLG